MSGFNFNQISFMENRKECHLVASFALLVLLFACIVYDLRNHQVPMLLTIGGMVGAGVYAIFNGLWAPVTLMIALTLVADINPREKRLAFALALSAFSVFFQPATTLMCIVILVVWLLWDFGILGGADVKLLIAATLVLGNPIVLIPISVIGGVQGVIASLQKKKEIPFVVSIFCGTLLFMLYSYF
jgi:Flp pilus assembly protein protease CpaA